LLLMQYEQHLLFGLPMSEHMYSFRPSIAVFLSNLVAIYQMLLLLVCLMLLLLLLFWLFFTVYV